MSCTSFPGIRRGVGITDILIRCDLLIPDLLICGIDYVFRNGLICSIDIVLRNPVIRGDYLIFRNGLRAITSSSVTLSSVA